MLTYIIVIGLALAAYNITIELIALIYYSKYDR
jgi:hypothetical protein